MMIPDGKCVIHSLTIGFLDSSLCGYESLIKAEGLISQDATVQPFSFENMDMTFGQFLAEFPDVSFYTYGTIHIFDENRYLNMSIAAIAFDAIKALFPDLKGVPLKLESCFSIHYDAMRAASGLWHEWKPRIN